MKTSKQLNTIMLFLSLFFSYSDINAACSGSKFGKYSYSTESDTGSVFNTQFNVYTTLHAYKMLLDPKSSISGFRTGLYVRNYNILSGLNVGYQRTLSMTDSINTYYHQIPVHWSNWFFLRRDIRKSSPFLKLDIGTIISEFVEYDKGPGISRKDRKSIPSQNLFTMSVSFGLGYKWTFNDQKTGLSIDASYNILPTYAPTKSKNQMFSLSIGLLF